MSSELAIQAENLGKRYQLGATQGVGRYRTLRESVADLVKCIRLCLDCADLCDATANIGLRQTGMNDQVLRETLELCARACDECAAECERQNHEHCKLCAQMCRECAEDCRNAAASVGS